MLLFLRTETAFVDTPFTTAKSAFPSLSRSPTVIQFGEVPVKKSDFAMNKNDPTELIFLNIETVLLLLFAAAISCLPSPSKSRITTHDGELPDTKSIFCAKEIFPAPLLIFLKIETVLLLPFATTKSCLPSPSKSSIAILNGKSPVA